MISNVEFREADNRPRTESLPLSHLSIEVGHLYAEDFRAGGKRVEEHIEQVAPWVHQAERQLKARLPEGVRPRVSTCFLINDHLPGMPGPRETIERLQKAAADNEVTIDYLARESNCAHADGVALASWCFRNWWPTPRRPRPGAGRQWSRPGGSVTASAPPRSRRP